MPEATQPRLVGRETELRRLLALLDDAAAGRPVVALVSGDAGVGQTRLGTELGEARGASGPVLDALAARPGLSGLRPDIGPGRPPGGDMPGLAQQQLFGAVLGMLAELAEASPVLLVLEDLHWADRSTRDLVTFLSRMLRNERIAL